LQRLSVIACPSLRADLTMLATERNAILSFHHLESGLHEYPADKLRAALQAAIDQTTDCDAILVCYGLCSRSVVGISARQVPVVIPRAHDCIGILLGSCKRYLAELDRHPGTYFQSAGWIKAMRSGPQPQFTFGPNRNVTREDLTEHYGAEAADFLMGEFAGFTRYYRRLAYIATPVGDAQKWEAEARSIASARGWAFDRLDGNTGWMKRMLDGDWQEHEFLILQPGTRVALAADERLILAEAI
jgi:hypothetical protein